MDAALRREEEHYTYEDYCAWEDDGRRWELIDGVPYLMSPPGPSENHQDISMEFSRQLANFLKGKPCKVFAAPFDVRLNPDKGDDTVVQPDVLVVCDRSKLDGKACVGAPDLVVEILSPSTSGRDKVLKYNRYLQAGVREYWLVDPEDRTVQVCSFEKGTPMSAYGEKDEITVGVLPGCTVKLAEVFDADNRYQISDNR